MQVDQVIRLLADGNVHSGEELGELLGVSRTAVWKKLKKLEPLGLQLTTVKGQGYQLAGTMELLDRDFVYSTISDAARHHISVLEIHGSIDSTNRLALERAQEGDGHGYVCVAEHQSAGRGRRGRQWHSPFGRNIYLSTAWEFSGGAAVLEGLSLAVGVGLLRALKRHHVGDVQLKWPNDVLWQNKKLAGILLEMAGDAAGTCQVVVGVGLNVAMPEVEAQAIDQPWTSVANITDRFSRNGLLVSMIDELIPLLANYQRDGFAPYHAEWEAADSFRNREVEIRAGKNSIVGTVVGVDHSGALRLLTEDGEQLIYGGEASARNLHQANS